MNRSITTILELLKIILPRLIEAYEHYMEIVKSNKFTLEDKEKAKKILQDLRWKKWEEIEKEVKGE